MAFFETKRKRYEATMPKDRTKYALVWNTITARMALSMMLLLSKDRMNGMNAAARNRNVPMVVEAEPTPPQPIKATIMNALLISASGRLHLW